MCKACDYTIHGRQHHFGWDNSFVPAERVAPGSTILFHCHDSSAGQLGPSSTLQDVINLDFGKINPVSGPIYIEGAEPGDAVKVTIDSFAPNPGGFGWTANIPGFGLLADQFTDPALIVWKYDAASLEPALWGDKAKIPLKPFAGTIGNALAEKGLHSVVPPRRVGGNLDIRDLAAGTTLYLPVDVPGALLSLGDIHFSQGDGEVCGTAIECHGQARIRVTPLREVRHRPTTPLVESTEPAFRARRHVTTTGLPIDGEGVVHPMDLTLCARNAIAQMIRWLGDEAGLSPEQAYVLCSATVDLRISEVVDIPHPVVSALCPLDVFTEIRPQRG